MIQQDQRPASWRAAWALGEMDAAARPAVPKLMNASRRTSDQHFREMIAEALESIGDGSD